ncbi:odorant receptor 85c-like [Tenebrio molitor]|uniref:odorant receptor 85c-like n=1 Tax=Tenebrio molitor TaxID=7067 RepID=UPI003624A3E2
MVFIYVKNQPKVALLLRDLSNFYTFGLPPEFEQQEKVLNVLSNVSFAYAIFASLLYNLVRLYQKPECEETKMEKEICGFIVPVWLPFEMDYFPLYELGFFYMYASTVLILKSALVIPFHAFEISQHIILRIKHLNTIIIKCLDGDYEECRKNLQKCIHYHREIIDCMFCHLTITAAVCACIEKQFVEGDKLCAGLHVIGWFLVLFISCVAGQFLTDASASIPEAIWNSRWRQADLKLKKDVLFLLLRCQRNIYFSAGPFGILSFNLFVGVVKMSYSILCLLTS